MVGGRHGTPNLKYSSVSGLGPATIQLRHGSHFPKLLFNRDTHYQPESVQGRTRLYTLPT